jgi:cysteine-rich repeat protein/predicted outer membrane repeat protein
VGLIAATHAAGACSSTASSAGSSGNDAGGDGGTGNTSSDAAGDVGAACGNNHLDGGETCDDGNTVDGDTCSADCSTSHSVLYVDETASGANDGSTWADAFNRLTLALQAAQKGSNIWIARGRYTPSTAGGSRNASFVTPDGVGLYGGFTGSETGITERNSAPSLTVLGGDLNGDDTAGQKADNSYRVIQPLGSLLIDGITVSGGYGDSASAGSGSAIYIGETVDASVAAIDLILRNVVFEDNHALAGTSPSGGAIFFNSGDTPARLIVEDCQFHDNSATVGGAIYVQQPAATITRSVFENNTAVTDGGAVFTNAWSTLEVEDSTFRGNQASQGYGGAIGTYYIGGDLTVRRSTFENNTGTRGGAIGFTSNGMTLRVSDALFVSNTADDGGAVFSSMGSGTEQPAGAELVNVTAYGNSSPANGAVASSSAPLSVVNSIVWGSTSALSPPHFSGDGTLSVTFSDVEGSALVPGLGNMNADPGFVGVPTDFELGSTSPCIDVADDSIASTMDLAGNPRVNVPLEGADGTSADLGAYEFQP